MISILIPVYNYHVVPLVNLLYKQMQQVDFPVELHLLDDCSTNLNFEKKNREVAQLERVYYQRSEKNRGRTATRNLLAEAAQYDQLLFIDADMLPVSDCFLQDFARNAQENTLVFGGILYEKEKPKGKELRWKYGKSREAKSISKRQKNPSLSVISMVFLIEKALFLQLNRAMENRYGMDVLFTAQLERSRCQIKHIENPAYHCGLEPNGAFLEKSKQAMQSIAHFEKTGQIGVDYRGIQKLAILLKKYGLQAVFCRFYEGFEAQILKNLKSTNPSLKFFDAFRLYALIQS